MMVYMGYLFPTQHTFIAPSKSGTYTYEFFGEYSNGILHPYLKIKVK